MLYKIKHKTNGVEQEIPKKEWEELKEKQAFKNSFIFQEIPNGESLEGVPIDQVIEKQKKSKPAKPADLD